MKFLLLFSISCIFLLSACNEPEDRTDAYKDLSEDDKKRVLKSYNAETVIGHEGIYFKSTKSNLKDCSLCHDKPIKSDNDGKQSHWNIKLNHSDKMNCQTCHDEAKPQELITGIKKFKIEHSYKSCSSCHFQQYEDWKGGAHGKRISGWKEPRVINNCVTCHDPHSPAFKHDSTVAHPDIIPDRLKKIKNHK
jgi:hypothetical protein